MIRCLLVTVLLLAGCGARRDAVAPIEETPQERACRAEARDAPALRALARESNPNSLPNQERLAAERRLAENAAFVACLRRAGAASPGGVEPLRER